MRQVLTKAPTTLREHVGEEIHVEIRDSAVHGSSKDREANVREYPEAPVVAVGTVILDGERALLIQRSNEPGRGRWSIPGGTVELGETLREAALREVREECGLEVELGDVVDVYEVIRPDEGGRIRFHYVLVDFVAQYRGGEPIAGSDSLDVTWATREQVERLDLPERLRILIRRVLPGSCEQLEG